MFGCVSCNKTSPAFGSALNHISGIAATISAPNNTHMRRVMLFLLMVLRRNPRTEKIYHANRDNFLLN